MKRTECPRCGDFDGHVVATQPHWQLVKCETCSFLDWRSTKEVAQVPVPVPVFGKFHRAPVPGVRIKPELLRFEIIALSPNEYHLKVSMRDVGSEVYKYWRHFPMEHAHGYTFLDELFQEFLEWLFKWYEVY